MLVIKRMKNEEAAPFEGLYEKDIVNMVGFWKEYTVHGDRYLIHLDCYSIYDQKQDGTFKGESHMMASVAGDVRVKNKVVAVSFYDGVNRLNYAPITKDFFVGRWSSGSSQGFAFMTRQHFENSKPDELSKRKSKSKITYRGPSVIVDGKMVNLQDCKIQ